jgi:hypothetical protein
VPNSRSTSVLKKPRRDFALKPRGDGRWCKRVHGKLRYFTGTAQEALDEWNRVKEHWLAGAKHRLSAVELFDQYNVGWAGISKVGGKSVLLEVG